MKAKKKSGSFQFELSFKAAQEYFEVDEIKEYLSSGITKILFRFFKGVLLLPAERAGLNLFFKELNVSRSALVDELKNASAEDLSKLLNSKTAIYPQPVTDYLHIISRLALSETELKIYDHFSEQLIKEIIQGTYQIDEEQIYFIPSGNNIKINFHVSSSAVKTLFGLFYCLTSMNDLDSCLIIDEPELNLHPDNQRKIARLLARLANRGIPVIISTHSDYIVKEINNLVMLKEDFPEKKALMKKYGYAEAELLSPDMLSINLVSGGKVTSLVVNSTEGVAVETFDRVINDLNESSDEIYYTKRDSLDE